MLIPLILVALSVAGCSSSDGGGTDASSAGPNLPTATSTTTGATGSPATATGGDTKAVCSRVIKIIQDSTRSAISALTPALQTGDQQKVAAAQVKAHAYYQQAATALRKEATSADGQALRKQIVNAAAYFEKAAQSATASGSDNSLATLSETCSS